MVTIGDVIRDVNDTEFRGTVTNILEGGSVLARSSTGKFTRQLSLAACIMETKKMNVLLIDWSVIAYEAWHKMARKDYISETSSEIVEFTRSIAKEAYYLKERFAPNEDDIIYFLLDSKNWRVPFYQSYYDKFLKAWRVKDKESNKLGYLFKHDTYTYLLWDGQEPKKGKKAVMLSDIKISNKAFNELKNSLRKKPIDKPYECEAIQGFLPRYKGNRAKQKWPYDTSKEDFKNLYRDQSARALARTLGAKLVQVEGAEADDIIYAASLYHSAHEITCVSADTDLDQIKSEVLFFNRWSPETGRRCYMTENPAESIRDIHVKVLCGDTADNIKPVTMGKTTIGKAKATKLVDETTDYYSGEWTKHPSFRRNAKLVLFPKMPEKILKACTTGVIRAEIPEGEPKHIKYYGVERTTLMSLKRQAQTERAAE